jgi:serine/threonine protein kinase/formylglycine-generating enzyme required for sulfatase activity
MFEDDDEPTDAGEGALRDDDFDGDTLDAGAAGAFLASGLQDRRLGPFRVLRLIGSGGQGEVYEARDERLGRRVALKVLSRHSELLSGDSGARLRARFEREAEAAARLNHPGLCAVYEYGESAGTPWIAMQLVEGHSLRDLISAERYRRDPEAEGADAAAEAPTQIIPRPDAISDVRGALAQEASATRTRITRDARHWNDRVLSIVEQLARALHVAHEAGLVHRDIKPGNVMIDAEDRPILLDFGLVTDESADGPSLTQSGELVGTPAYLAPEQIRGDGLRCDRRTDVHALGIVLFECISLRRPFEAASRQALYRQICEEEAPPLRASTPASSRDLAVVVATALEKDPDRRYATALGLAEDLRRLRKRLPIVARPVGPGQRAWRWVGRNPVVAALLALVIVLLTTGIAWTSFKNRELQNNLREYERLADLRRLAEARAEADAQWPLSSELIAPLEAWQDKYGALAGRLPQHRAALLQLRALESPDADARFRRDNLEKLCRELEEFAAPETGLLAEVERRLSDARRIRAATLDDPRLARAWREAGERIAGSPRYRGLDLKPQLGLIPLGPDPQSGLEEFLHWASQARPSREALDLDALAQRPLTADSSRGIVLVLVPGGRFTMGGEEQDPRAEPGEFPRADISLDAFFLAKYETTQAQWRRLTQSQPSSYGLGFIEAAAMSEAVHDLHPVETIDWHRAREVARRYGLELPTEAQWEYAARQARPDPRRANLAGTETRAFFSRRSDDHRDPFLIHAPVGSFPADALGLHDLFGNVWEWCRDASLDYSFSPRPGDGLRSEEGAERVIRGAAFNATEGDARITLRRGLDARTRDDFLGVRFARRRF